MDACKRKNIIQDLIVGLILTVITVTLGHWLETRSQLPIIEYTYSEVYAKLNDAPVGYINIGNSGKTIDTNISLTIDAKIDKNNISIPKLTSDYKIDYVGGQTILTLSSLRPNEEISIFFCCS